MLDRLGWPNFDLKLGEEKSAPPRSDARCSKRKYAGNKESTELIQNLVRTYQKRRGKV